MAASKKRRSGRRAALVVVLCLVLVCVAAAAVALGLVSSRIRAFRSGASFHLDYQITATTPEEPALYQVLEQFGGTTGSLEGQYAPEAMQLALYPKGSGTDQPLTRVYISGTETLYDAGQLYTTLRNRITTNYPLASLLMPGWSLGSYISQTQLASLLGVDPAATGLQAMNGFQLDLKKLKKVQPEQAREGYLYLEVETEDTSAQAPVLILGLEKQGLLRTSSPAVHILLEIPAHGVRVELTGSVTAATTAPAAPTSLMKDEDIAALVQLRQSIETVLQFVQGAAQDSGTAA